MSRISSRSAKVIRKMVAGLDTNGTQTESIESVSAAIWRVLEDDPEFVASMERGKADFAAGRTFLLDTTTGETSPSETWRPDDPQQPVGWHHDGQRWVKDDPER